MPRKKYGPYPIYDSEENCFRLWNLKVTDQDDFVTLPMYWIYTNTRASFPQKDAEWETLVSYVTRYHMYEWYDIYIHDYFTQHAKMYLPERFYNKLAAKETQ